MKPFEENDMYKDMGATVVVKGGGVTSHAEAIRHGLTRAFVAYNPEDRKHFKNLGFLTRDPRKRRGKSSGFGRHAALRSGASGSQFRDTIHVWKI